MSMNTSRWAYGWLKLQALAWLVLARREAALARYSTMLARWPNDAYARASRVQLYAQLGRRDDSLADAQSLTQAHPRRSADHWFNLGYLLGEAGRHAEAEPAFRTAIALDPGFDRAWYGLGLSLVGLQRCDEAIEAFERNTELQPMSPCAWYQVARVHWARHELDQARRVIRHLKAFEPKVAAQLERETGLVA